MSDSHRAPRPHALLAALVLVLLEACTGALSDARGPAGGPSGEGPATPGPDDPPRTRPDGIPIPGSDTCRPPPDRVWQLTPAQLATTLADAVPGAPRVALEERFLRTTVSGHPFTSDPEIENLSSLFTGELFLASRELIELLLASPGDLAPCLETRPDDSACALEAVLALAGRAWRRPPSVEERARLERALLDEREARGPELALRSALRRVLIGPSTIFRSELGALDPTTGEARLSPYEIADFMAFTLTDAPPDAELRAAADDGSLRDPAVAEVHARRLLAAAPAAETIADTDGRSRPDRRGIIRFFDEWLELDRVDTAPLATLLRTLPERDPIRELGPERLGRWLQNEPLLFIRHVLWEDDARLGTLLAADFTVYGNTLADYYGVPRPPPELGPTRHGRRGLLMMGGFLVGHDSATDRGRFVRERLFCEAIPSPPPDVDQNLAGISRDLEMREGRALSPREVRALHLGDESCAGCHTRMDPLGFPFDGFDALGLPQTAWPGGFPIDTGGAIEGTPSSDRSVADASTMMTHLAGASDVRACFVRQLFTFVHGRTPGASDTCHLERLERTFEEHDGDVLELLVAMVTGDETRARTPRWDDASGGGM